MPRKPPAPKMTLAEMNARMYELEDAGQTRTRGYTDLVSKFGPMHEAACANLESLGYVIYQKEDDGSLSPVTKNAPEVTVVQMTTVTETAPKGKVA